MKDRDQGSKRQGLGTRDSGLGKSPLRICESRACCACGEPSGEADFCERCDREMLAEEPEWLRRQEAMFFAPLPDKVEELGTGIDFERAGKIFNRFLLAFLIGGALMLAGCVVKGLLWVHFERWAR